MKRIKNCFQLSNKIRKLLFMISLFNLCAFTACNVHENGKDRRGAVMESNQEENVNKSHDLVQGFNMAQAGIYISDEWLYYCDSERDAALYAYNLHTKEEMCVTELQGIPYKTPHGFFYLVEKKVYEIKAFEAMLLCELPECGEFIDYAQNKVIWTARGNVTVDSFEYYPKQSIHLWKKDGEGTITRSSSKMLYDISSGSDSIGDVILINNVLYIGQSNGLYCLDCETMEIECIFENDILHLSASDDEIIIFNGLEDAGGSSYSLYALHLENRLVQKIDHSAGSTFAAVNDGVLYYNSSGIASYDLKDGSYKALSADLTLGRQAYTEATFFENCLVLRNGYNYRMYLYDIRNNTFTSLVPEQ